MLCDTFCGTHVHIVDGKPYNDRDNKPHKCSKAQTAREFEGYYNMIQIRGIRLYAEELKQGIIDVTKSLSKLQETVNNMSRTLDWQEEQNKPLSEAFIKRKEAGRKRNHQ